MLCKGDKKRKKSFQITATFAACKPGYHMHGAFIDSRSMAIALRKGIIEIMTRKGVKGVHHTKAEFVIVLNQRSLKK